MKKLILILSLFASTVQAQQDTITMQDMQYNLYVSHKQYREGTVVVIIGLLTMIASSQFKSTEMKMPELNYIGGGLIAVGGFIQIDSHKWLGRSCKLWKKSKQRARK